MTGAETLGEERDGRAELVEHRVVVGHGGDGRVDEILLVAERRSEQIGDGTVDPHDVGRSAGGGRDGGVPGGPDLGQRPVGPQQRARVDDEEPPGDAASYGDGVVK